MTNVKSYKFRLSGVDLKLTLEKKNEDGARLNTYSPEYRGKHYHAEWELLFVLNSPLTVYTESGSKTFENTIVCIPPRFDHSTNNRDNFKLLFTFKLSSEEYGSFSSFISDCFTKNVLGTLTPSSKTFALLSELDACFALESEIAEEMTEAALKLLFSDIFLTNTKRIQRGASKGNESYLVRIENVIGDFKRDISLSTVSSILGVCPRQASRIIKSNYGATLSELLERKRLGVAKDMLSSSDMSISEIVEYINFSSESYFYSRFKKVFGTTPAKYREKQE